MIDVEDIIFVLRYMIDFIVSNAIYTEELIFEFTIRFKTKHLNNTMIILGAL
jgi:hypothetical protein